MAFQAKTDYSGLTTIKATLKIREDNPNNTAETYQPDLGDGSYADPEVYGEDSAPTNSFGIPAGGLTFTAGEIKLGKVTTVSTTPYALESISFSSGPNTATTLTSTCKEVESGATDASAEHYSLPALTLDSKMKAQIFFDAFTVSGASCDLISTSGSAACQINRDSVEGTKISSCIGHGLLTVSGTILQRGATAPTVTPATGWAVTAPLVCSNPEAQYKSWTFTVTKPLAKDAASAS